MDQVLLQIPLTVGGVPVWPFVLGLFLAVAAAVWFGAPYAAARWGWEIKDLRSLAFWIAAGGGVAAAVAYGFRESGLPVFGFGAMLFVAFLVSNWVAGRRAAREGVAKETIQDLAIWIIVAGIIGARLVSIYTQPRSRWPADVPDFLYRLIQIWEGGIVLYGAVIGGLIGYGLAYWFVLRKQRASTAKLADVVAPALALGVCIGRLGCFLNGCCFGQVVCPDCAAAPVPFPFSAPARFELTEQGYQTAAGFTVSVRNGVVWVERVEPGSAADKAGIQPGDVIRAMDGKAVGGEGAKEKIDALLGMGKWPRGKNDLTLTVHSPETNETQDVVLRPWTLPLHPTQIYESVSMLLLFLVLTAYYPFRRRDGQVMAVLMACYGAHRCLNELLRADDRPVYSVEIPVSVALFVAGVGLWLWLQYRPAQYRTEAAAPAAARKAPASTAVRPAKA
jgi:phosphatidylglycerol:prolipoprotein diacylglycerol transferase